jgi:multidrug efflux pump subunit AcrB
MMSITPDPEMHQVLSAMALMNMEGEGITEVRKFFRDKLIKMGALKPTDKEAQELAEQMQNTPPDPNSQYLQSAAAQAEAEATKARADTLRVLAQAEKTKAETIETLSQIAVAEQNHALDALGRIQTVTAPPNEGRVDTGGL